MCIDHFPYNDNLMCGVANETLITYWCYIICLSLNGWPIIHFSFMIIEQLSIYSWLLTLNCLNYDCTYVVVGLFVQTFDILCCLGIVPYLHTCRVSCNDKWLYTVLRQPICVFLSWLLMRYADRSGFIWYQSSLIFPIVTFCISYFRVNTQRQNRTK